MDWNTFINEFFDGPFIHMIAVDMSNEDPIKILQAQTQSSQVTCDVGRTESTVDKNRCPGVPNKRGISCA